MAVGCHHHRTRPQLLSCGMPTKAEEFVNNCDALKNPNYVERGCDSLKPKDVRLLRSKLLSVNDLFFLACCCHLDWNTRYSLHALKTFILLVLCVHVTDVFMDFVSVYRGKRTIPGSIFGSGWMMSALIFAQCATCLCISILLA